MNTNTEKRELNDTEERCGGCGRRCPLSELKCERGRRLNGGSEMADWEHGSGKSRKGERDAHGREEEFLHGEHGSQGEHGSHGEHGLHGERGSNGCRARGMHGGEGRHGERAGRTLPFDIDAEGTKGLYARLRECGHYLFHRQGAYVGQERVLKELSENGGTMSQRELTERLQLQRASVSEILGKLELRALIEREQSMRDRRSQDISLTAEGKRAAEGVAGRQEAEYNGLFDEITEEEQKTLYELLGKLLEKWRGKQK